ncbi:unnamed protein product [Amaranthus hypochondriacus]
MRTGGCSILQSLTPEATTIVKQAINLARTRNHAQVTPIHIATIMLSSPAGLLKSACLKSHPHPLQCKALQLCFNVALNRLSSITPNPILSPHSHYPSLANALMAAFKRAQAHQRRGSIETQQQPILSLKIETEQLVISILDDPSVSRVMREAGFSSTHVKSNLASLDTSSQLTNNQNFGTIIASSSEDVSNMINMWAKRKEKMSVVLIGECLSSCESVVKGVKERIERGDLNVPLELRYVQFLNYPLSIMKNLSREEIDLKFREIRCVLKGCIGRGVVLYLGDLRWVAEYWAYYGEQRRHYYNCPNIDYIVMGLRRLLFGNLDISGKLWLMGIATFKSYLKCKSGIPSLETLLDLYPLTIPAGTLDLSLNLDSSLQEEKKSDVSVERIRWPLVENKIDKELICCIDCSTNCHREVRNLAANYKNSESSTTTKINTTTTSSSLPSWLQKCKLETKQITNHEETMQIKELCKKWNSICSTIHKSFNYAEKTINFSSSPPSSPTSGSSYDKHKIYFHDSKSTTTSSWPIMYEPKWASKEHPFFLSNLETKPELISNPNSTPNSASSSEATEVIIDTPSSFPQPKFNKNNPENLKAMCLSLEKKVPWQKQIIPEIATTILKIRSGVIKRKKKMETWLSFMGVDEEGKLAIGRELAKLIFGSYNSFKTLDLSSFSSSDELRTKRLRDEAYGGYLKRFADAVKENPHQVFYLEDIEQTDDGFQKGVKNAIETGEIKLSNGEKVLVEDAIVIFSCEGFSSGSRACSPNSVKKKLNGNDDQELNEFDKDVTSCFSLDLNVTFEKGKKCVASVGNYRILDLVDKQIFFRTKML